MIYWLMFVTACMLYAASNATYKGKNYALYKGKNYAFWTVLVIMPPMIWAIVKLWNV